MDDLRKEIAVQIFTVNGAAPTNFWAMREGDKQAYLTAADRVIEEVRQHDAQQPA